MRTGFLIGRHIAGLFYLFSGINGFVHLATLTGFAASRGVPSPELAVLAAHALLIVAAFCLLTGYHPDLGVACLIVFFVPVTAAMHAFWRETDPVMRAQQSAQFLKNAGLLGSSLMFLAIPRPWYFSLDAASTRSSHGPRRQVPAHP